MVNIDTFGTPITNPLDSIEDKTEEDKFLHNANLDVYPETLEEKPEAYNEKFLALIFRTETRSSQFSVVMFLPFDKEGLRVKSLHLEVDPYAHFRMLPCRFNRYFGPAQGTD